MSPSKVAFLGPAAVVTPLAFRAALSFEGNIPDLLILLSVGAAFTFGFPLSSFTFISLLFPTPIAFLAFSGLDFRLSYFLAAGLGLSSIIKMLRRRSSLWPLLAGGLWVFGFIASGTVPFWKQQDLADGSGPLNYHFVISLVFSAGFLFGLVCDRQNIRLMVTKIAEALVALFGFWLFAVWVILTFAGSTLFQLRTDEFLFPIDAGHVVTGVFMMVLVLYVSLRNNRFALRSHPASIVTIFLLATALCLTTSRAAAVASSIVVVGLLGQAIHDKKLNFFWFAVSVTAGYAFAAVVSSGSAVGSAVGNFARNPVAQDIRISLLREGFDNAVSIVGGDNPSLLLFGVGYNQTLEFFGGDHDAHNDLVTTFVERGLIGSFIIFFPLYFLLRQSITLFWRAKLLATAGGASFFVMLFLSLVGMTQPVFFFIGISFALGTKKAKWFLAAQRPAT